MSVVALVSWGVSASAADQAGATAVASPANGQVIEMTKDQSSFSKASWLTDVSLSVKESYDDNIYLSGVASKYLPSSYTLPPGSVAALKDKSSFVTTVTPKIGVNFAPLLGDTQNLQTLSLGYAPEIGRFQNAPAENYVAHSFPAAVKGNWEAFSVRADNTLNYVSGSSYGPTYPGGFLNAYATCAPREHREQFNDRGTLAFQYDFDKWFVRPTASLLYYDMMTKKIDVTGYQNYASRYDINGGPDFGYRVEPQLAVTLGYRYGHQYQEQFGFTPYSSPSDYQRVLVGIEGKPWKWLEIKLQGGPDFRSYYEDTATHITPVNHTHLVTYYGEASLTATITTKDTVTFAYKQFQWVSQLGKIPYFDSTYKLNYRRRFDQPDHPGYRWICYVIRLQKRESARLPAG